MFELYLMIKTSASHVDRGIEASEKSSFVSEYNGVAYFSVVTPAALELEKKRNKQMFIGRLLLSGFTLVVVTTLCIILVVHGIPVPTSL